MLGLLAIRNPQSAIRNPQSAIRNPQSASVATCVRIALNAKKVMECWLNYRSFIRLAPKTLEGKRALSNPRKNTPSIA